MLSAIILAAGESKRMGRYIKALLPVHGITFLEKILENLDQPEIGETFVILGSGVDEIHRAVNPGKAKFLINEDWRSGQLGSLRVGVSHLSQESEAVLFTPVDHPLVERSTYRTLIDFWWSQRAGIVVPTYRGRKGHPALFPRRVYGALLNDELFGGARDILDRKQESVSYVEVSDPGVVQDIDTLEDFRRLIGELP
jgi:molybdenum cofactor cytidylyltransferase